MQTQRGRAHGDRRSAAGIGPRHDALKDRDDRFDLSDALLAIAIAMMAVTMLTRLWPLYRVSLLPTGFGLLRGLAGLCRWQIRFTSLAKLLNLRTRGLRR